MIDEPGLDVASSRERLRAILGETHANLYPVEVEKHFPHILVRIVELWGSPELDYYFEGVITTSRHDREGFPEAVVLELFHLSNLHSGFHLSDLTKKSPWDMGQDRDLSN